MSRRRRVGFWRWTRLAWSLMGGESFSLEEVATAMGLLKEEKAPRLDGILPTVLRRAFAATPDACLFRLRGRWGNLRSLGKFPNY